MGFDGSGLIPFLFGVFVGLLIAFGISRWKQHRRRRLRSQAGWSDIDQPLYRGYETNWGNQVEPPQTPRDNANIDWLDFGLDGKNARTISVPREHSVDALTQPSTSVREKHLPIDAQTLAVQLFGSDIEEFRRRFRPQVVEPDRQRLDEDPNDVLVHEQSDGSYWLISLPDRVGLVFPRPNRAFGRGMMQYAAAPFLFEIQGFQEGFRYRRSIVRAPVRMSPEGDGWRRHTRGVLQVLDGEPDE